MWGEPRQGTEAYAVKKEAERLQKIAIDKGLVSTFSEAYHDSIFAYGSWISDKNNKKYVYPKVTKVKESNIKRDNKNIKIVDFTLGKNKYRVEEYRHFGFGTDQEYVELELYLNGKKVFAITETETSNEWTTTYHPVTVDAYVNEDWVDDFSSIKKHRKDTDRLAELDYAENPERVKQVKENFGITEIKHEYIAPPDTHQTVIALIVVIILGYIVLTLTQ